MYRIIDGRGTGKTGRLMLLAKETNGTIVCSNPRAMREKAIAYGIVGIDFISYNDFLYGAGGDIGNYYIDELELFLACAQSVAQVRGKLCGYSLSEE
jgi:hypothetical protein